MSEERKGFFGRLRDGLAKTRRSIVSGFDGIFYGYSKIDEDFYDDIEEILVMADVGVTASDKIISSLRDKVKEQHISDPRNCRDILKESIKELLDEGRTDYTFENRKSIVLVVGVNGVGKTTSIGKLAAILERKGKKVIIAAADTFRAAACEQLAEWARRAGADIVSGQEGSDPGSVVYDAIAAARARRADILIIDTAGRLHNKKNLMNELGKISRIISREAPDAFRETLVVLDGTTGQNALSQAREFQSITPLTGIILTKLDGTAKGGIALAVHMQSSIPVKYIGVGEKIDDLQKFDIDSYVDALFAK